MMRSKNSSRSCRRRGLTLIEVMASLAILGSLLVSLLMAKARSIQQWNAANRRIEATAAADGLLAEWWPKPSTLPRQATGKVAGTETLSWRTRVIEDQAMEGFGIEIVRLEIIDEQTVEKMDPLITVDLLLNHEEPKRH